MEAKMSIQTRKELLFHILKRYKRASWINKSQILDELVATTGYRRKYAIHLLNLKDKQVPTNKSKRKPNTKKYNEDAKQALITIWCAANCICSKRLVPFIPELLAALERFGHISLPLDVRNLLLKISPATVDRLLETTRKESRKGLSTTCSGSLLKKQIKIRTFADWNDVIPGFMEGDLVAHCGDRTDGAFLNSLVITDIASTWTEFFPLLKKGAAEVINALKVAQQVLPFPLLGLDTDNGTEFINYALLEFCKAQEVTFTRSRPYKKNDQAHVEEKNGSIIRKLVGYDRYEGLDAYAALSKLYGVLRLYVNFFQPSLKLISKTRIGAKVTKKYDKAKTPYQRLMSSSNIIEEIKIKLKKQFEELDPVELLKNLEELQNNFWKHAWQKDKAKSARERENKNILDLEDSPIINHENGASNNPALQQSDDTSIAKLKVTTNESVRRYRRTKQKRALRNWRTRADPFGDVWDSICQRLQLNPILTARDIVENLMKENVGQFNLGHVRTMQRRIAKWRATQMQIIQESNSKKINSDDDAISKYILLIAQSVINE
jgi:hypothetical protein